MQALYMDNRGHLSIHHCDECPVRTGFARQFVRTGLDFDQGIAFYEEEPCFVRSLTAIAYENLQGITA